MIYILNILNFRTVITKAITIHHFQGPKQLDLHRRPHSSSRKASDSNLYDRVGD